MTATRDVSEIARRMQRLFAARGMSPKITSTPEKFTAERDISRREIDGGMYVIDRRRNHPRHTIPHDTAGARGFRIRVSMMPMLPQILTQYVSPSSPRGGISMVFTNKSPAGEVVSTTQWFTPDDDGHPPPFLVVEFEIGKDLPDSFVAAVLDQIAPVIR